MKSPIAKIGFIVTFTFGCAAPSPRFNSPSPERMSVFGAMSRQPESHTEGRLAKALEDSSMTRVDKSVWRTTLPASTTFQMLTRILSQSYIISQADKKQLTIATDWDKFFINGRLFRNRLSAAVFPLQSRGTEIVFKNTVEYFSGSKDKADMLSDSNWLPTQDVTDEIPRIVDTLVRQSAEWAKVPESRIR